MNPVARNYIKSAREQLCFAQQRLLPSQGTSMLIRKDFTDYNRLDEAVAILERVLQDNPLPKTEKLI